MGGPPAKFLPALAIAFTEPNLIEVDRSFDRLPGDARIGQAAVEGDGKLLGASIVAPDGEHLGHLVALATERRMCVTDFVDQPWYHPTVEELLQTAARDLLGTDE